MSASPDPTGQYRPGGHFSGVMPLRQKCLEGHVMHFDNPVTLLTERRYKNKLLLTKVRKNAKLDNYNRKSGCEKKRAKRKGMVEMRKKRNEKLGIQQRTTERTLQRAERRKNEKSRKYQICLPTFPNFFLKMKVLLLTTF